MVDTSTGRRVFGLFVRDDTPEYRAKHDEWCLALGRFIDAFAEAEHHLRRLLIRHAKVTDQIGRALFLSGRVSEMKDDLNRILDATLREQTKKELDPFLTHLGVIAGVRNNIVHWGAFPLDSGDFIVSNAHMASIERIRGHRVNAADIAAMTDDLHSISAALFIARERTRPLGLIRWPLLQQLEPWQYKPRPLPPLGTRRPPTRPQEQQRQRASSPKKR